jgi:hypothetical protein
MIDTFAHDVRRAAQLLLYIPEQKVVSTLGRSMPVEDAYLVTRAAYVYLTYFLENASQGEA